MEHAHTRAVVSGFTAQAESFNSSQVASDADVLDAIIAIADPRPGEHWLEAACGPGLIARRLAPLVSTVEGYDLTPAMIDVARRESIELDNVRFEIGDATALPVSAGRFDGVVTRFSIHHIPLPARMLRELGRVVKPGGRIVVADTVADAEPGAAAWSQTLERLRDPTHWASLSIPQMHATAEQAGLSVEEETVIGLELDFDDWLARGASDAADQALVEDAVSQQPPRAVAFVVAERGGRRVLRLQMWLARLRV